jgi:putative transposase
MARLSRLFIPEFPQLMRLKAAHGQQPFFSPSIQQLFLSLLGQYARPCGVVWHAYALVGDTALLMATPASKASLGTWVQTVNRFFIPRLLQELPAALRLSGPVWAPRFKSTVVEPSSWALKACLWVDTAPQRLGLTTSAYSFPWSSFAAHLGGFSDSRLTQLSAYWALGNTPFERQAAYRELAEKGLSQEDNQAIQYALEKSWALIDNQRLEQTQLIAPRPLLPRPRGRPRKTIFA